MSEPLAAYCDACGRQRVRGIIVARLSAEVLFHECPNCGHRWHAHPRGSLMWTYARRFIETSIIGTD